MEYVELGKTGRRVSRLGFGGAPAGLKDYVHAYDPQADSDRDAVIQAIRRAAERGITYFDTAPAYGDGASEEIFREGLAEAETILRSRNARPGAGGSPLFVATKCLPADADGVRRSVESSLKRLDRDALDLIQIHGTAYTCEQVSAALAGGGMVDEMERLKSEGLVRFIGFTGESQDQRFFRFLDSDRFDVMQVCYNIMYQHPHDPYWMYGSMPQAEARGMGIVTMRTLTSGIFQRWFAVAFPGVQVDLTRALLQFQLSNPLIDVALVGMRSAAEVETNADVADDTAGRIDLRQIHEHYPPAPGDGEA